MNKESATSKCQTLGCILWDSILMMGAYITESDSLKLSFHIVYERLFYKAAIICMVGFDLNTASSSKMFKVMLALKD